MRIFKKIIQFLTGGSGVLRDASRGEYHYSNEAIEQLRREIMDGHSIGAWLFCCSDFHLCPPANTPRQ